MQWSPVSNPIIDIHRHVANPSLLTTLASIPREVFIEERPAQKDVPKETIRVQMSELSDIDAQVQAQDQAGVTKGVLSNPFRLADLKPHAGSVAGEIAAILNDDLATVVSKHPSKLDFLATVHPFEPGCAQEADRSLTQLGAKGLTLCTSYADRWLDDQTLNPFWEYVQSRNVALFLHPPITPAWLPLNDIYPMQEMLHRTFDIMTICNAARRDLQYLFFHARCWFLLSEYRPHHKWLLATDRCCPQLASMDMGTRHSYAQHRKLPRTLSSISGRGIVDSRACRIRVRSNLRLVLDTQWRETHRNCSLGYRCGSRRSRTCSNNPPTQKRGWRAGEPHTGQCSS